jgi:spore germination protein
MYTHNKKISPRQARLLLILQMFNTSILILPKEAAKWAGQDGYLLPIGAFVVGSLYILVISALSNRFPDEDVVTYSKKLLTKPVGTILVMVFAIQILVIVGLEARMFSEMIGKLLLPKTPIDVILLILLLSTTYLVKSGVEAIGRMAEIIVYFVVVPLVLVLSFGAVKTDYRQLLPFFTAELKDMVKGVYLVSLTFLPVQFLLVLSNKINKKNKIKTIGLWAVGVIALIEIAIIVLTFTGIGVKESMRQVWPVVALMQNIQLPGSFVENQEILMMSWWVLSIYMYISTGLFVSSTLFSELADFKRENITLLPLVPVVFFIAKVPETLNDTYRYFTNFTNRYGTVFLLFVPLILLVLALLTKKGECKNENN